LERCKQEEEETLWAYLDQGRERSKILDLDFSENRTIGQDCQINKENKKEF
jgi:hypothetical protein